MTHLCGSDNSSSGLLLLGQHLGASDERDESDEKEGEAGHCFVDGEECVRFWEGRESQIGSEKRCREFFFSSCPYLVFFSTSFLFFSSSSARPPPPPARRCFVSLKML